MYGTISAWGRPSRASSRASSVAVSSCAAATAGRPRAARAQTSRSVVFLIGLPPVSVVVAEATSARAEIGRVQQQLDVRAGRKQRQRVLERGLAGLVGTADHQRLAAILGELGRGRCGQRGR